MVLPGLGRANTAAHPPLPPPLLPPPPPPSIPPAGKQSNPSPPLRPSGGLLLIERPTSMPVAANGPSTSTITQQQHRQESRGSAERGSITSSTISNSHQHLIARRFTNTVSPEPSVAGNTPTLPPATPLDAHYQNVNYA